MSPAMASLDDQFDNIFASDFNRYPDAPHSASSYDTSNTSPMDMGSSSMYGLTPSSAAGFEQSLYAEASNYILHHSRASPGVYPDEGELRHTLTSSSLSTNSATSSAAASPQSNPSHHMSSSSTGREWHHHHQGLHPSIVGNDYGANPEYAGFSGAGMDEYFEFAQSKSFVGKWLFLPLHFLSGFILLFPFSRC